MPREASKRNNWEKERRERFNRTFDELAKILPSYNPSVTINRINILKEAITTISEFKKEIGKLSESPGEVATFKDTLIKKLQDRIKKLIIRNEQLVKLFQEAGIKLPRAKTKINKENKPSTKIKKQKAAKTQGNKHLKSNNGTRKPPQSKKFTKKIFTTNVLFPRLQTIPIYNRQFVLVPSQPVVNNTQIATVLTGSPKKSKSKKLESAMKDPEIKPPPSTLRSGTFILANGNIISVVSQSQVVVPPLQPLKPQTMINPPIQSIKIPPSMNLSINPQPAINLALKIKPVTATNTPKIKSKDCLTKTTQINKVPIPALTSKYGNCLMLLKNQNNKKNEINKSNTVKRKLENTVNKTTKKRKIGEKTSKSNNENMGSKDACTEHKDILVDSFETVGESTNLVKKTDFSQNVLGKTNENMSKINNNQDIIKTTTSASAVSKIQTEKETTEMSNMEIITPVSTACTIGTPSEDLNIVHSDLSNDIFASLQVPPGSQNIESTSPTAAFLLTFPLVSSIKVNEVIDDNCDSQKDTPSLLQIESIDTSKPSQNDSLLNLDNFTFFNSKEIYTNSKNEDGSNREITELNQFEEMENLQKNKAEQRLELYKEKSIDFVEDEQNNLIVQSSDVLTYDVNQRGDKSMKNQPENVTNDEVRYNCLKNDQQTLIEKNSMISNSFSSSVEILENRENNEQHKLNNIPPNSGKNLKISPTEQQNVNIVSSTSKLSLETNLKHGSNKYNKIYNCNGNDLPSNNSENQDKNINSNASNNLLNDFFPNIKSSENNKNSGKHIDPSKTYCYQTQLLSNSQQCISSYNSSSNKASDEMSEKQKSIPEITYQPFLSNDINASLISVKLSETSAKNSNETEEPGIKRNYYSNSNSEEISEKFEESGNKESHQYNPNQSKLNYESSPAKMPHTSRIDLEKSDINKTYCKTTNFSSNSTSTLKKPLENLKEPETSKYQYNIKQFDQNFNSFSKVSKPLGSSLERHDKNKNYFLNTTNLSSIEPEKSDKNLGVDKPCRYNPKQIELNLIDFGPNLEKVPVKSNINRTYYNTTNFAPNSTIIMEKPLEHSEKPETSNMYQYNIKQFEQNLNSFTKVPESSENKLEKSHKNKSYFYNILPPDIPEKSSTNSDVSDKSCHYTTKQIEHNLNNFGPSLEEIPTVSEKTDSNKMYSYHTTNFPSNSTEFEQNFNSFAKDPESLGNNSEKPDKNKTCSIISEKSDKNSEDSDKICQYSSKEIENNLNNFAPNLEKIPTVSQNTDNKKTYCYNASDFSMNTEIPKKPNQISEESDATKSYQYNPKHFTVNLNSNLVKIPNALKEKLDKCDIKTHYQTTNYSSNSRKTPEKSAEIIGNSGAAKTVEFELNTNSFGPESAKISESSSLILDQEIKENKKYYYSTHTYSTFRKTQEKLALVSEKAGDTKICPDNPKEHVNSCVTNQVKNPESLGQNLGPYYYDTSKFSSNPGKSDKILEESNAPKVCNHRECEINSNTLGHNIVKVGETSGKSFKKSETNETYYFNTSNNFSNLGKNTEKTASSSNESDAVKTFQYNRKQFEVNIQTFAPTTVKISETLRQNSKNSETNKSHYYNSNDFSLNSVKMSEKPTGKLEETNVVKACQYNPKHFDINPQSSALNSLKISEASRQNLEKSVTNTYYYNTSNFSSNSTIMPEKSAGNLEESVISKSCQYNPKQFEPNLNSFGPNLAKLLEASEQNLEKSEINKTYYYNNAIVPSNSGKVTKQSNELMKTYQYNPFEVVQTSREIPLNETYNKLNISHKEKQSKVVDHSKILEGCPKSVEEKSCYFSSNSYENKHYANPFYSNCNYGYSENNFNQNYYKTDNKPSYSLNYENYQEYRRIDGSFTREKRNSTSSKEKQVQQNKPINWMTTEQKSHTSDCFLPTFTNQSYSFTSCITTDTNDNFADGKKTVETNDKRFTWSPSKLPNFLDVTHNFVTPTLPTLVGDLALGNSLPLTDSKYPKEVKRKPYENQANFLSVSQLVNQNKSESTPARTVSRRPSGSKNKNPAPNKKRFEKNIDKISKNVNNYNDVFYDQKNRQSTKNISSNYSAEALIGNQGTQEEKKFAQSNIKTCTNFSAENITYFTVAEDNYINQNHTYTHNSFQNNNCCSNSFIYTTPSITSSYLTNTFENGPDYSTENIMNYCGTKDTTNCGNKNYRIINKDDKNINYNHFKKNKKINQCSNTGLGNFEYPLLSLQGSTNSPILPDDFQSHSTFLPPTTPYSSKNSLYQKQGNEFNSTAILPLPGITRSNTQHPEVSPSLNPVGTSLTNFNLSTIFPEINKAPYNDSKYGFTG
ncbi:putative uncharacterized protein DDB_G0282133 [Diorhabda sublineata]|uniref:putative uncharacterized protein DDB_G0282133 n=1 Tax=Diorhabda sublineata TaxID=1163346 RepID=UPI0024E07860|nr:putative uncharacterized protein DDB_G0282133 [Diorhabda sublineata]